VSVRWTTGFLDTPDRSAESFWLAVTGSTASARRGAGGEFATLVPPDGDAFLRFQVVGAPPARCHLDLHVDRVPEAARRARVVRTEGDLTVLRSPAGLVFCLVPWAGEAVRPGLVGQGLVDQMCLDVPERMFDAEADFWAELTGWARRPGSSPRFEALQRPAGMPLRLLLQRIDSPVAGMHLDLAGADVPAEVARHVGLGATVLRVFPKWTTLRDPAGREYCVTSRSPVIAS
jgi:glyoxalase superfamily protein